MNYLCTVIPAYCCENCKIFTYVYKYLICGKCKSIRYCSIECQKSHYKNHKNQCKLEFQEYGSNLRKALKEYNKNFGNYVFESIVEGTGVINITKEIILDHNNNIIEINDNWYPKKIDPPSNKQIILIKIRYKDSNISEYLVLDAYRTVIYKILQLLPFAILGLLIKCIYYIYTIIKTPKLLFLYFIILTFISFIVVAILHPFNK